MLEGGKKEVRAERIEGTPLCPAGLHLPRSYEMKDKHRIAKGILLALLAIFIGVALASFDQRDVGSFWRVRNLCGPLGVYIALALRYLFGPLFSWWSPLLLAYVAYATFANFSIKQHRRQLVSALILLWMMISIAALTGRGEYGGIIGLRTVTFLELLSGRIGSVLILAAVFCIAVLVLFFGSIKRFFAGLSGLRLPRLPALRRERRPAVERVKKGRRRKPAPTAMGDQGEGRRRGDAPPVTEPLRKEAAVTIPAARKSFPRAAKSRPGHLQLPDIALLETYEGQIASYSKQELVARSDVIESKLRDYGLQGSVTEVVPGPVVTTFEFVPAPGVKVSQIANRSDDLALALAARAIRIQAPIPGKGAVGIEVPNPQPQIVPLREFLEHYPAAKEGLWIALGKTVAGEPCFADLADMPHLLIAGATGSGKSVCINSIICSLLFHHTPDTCRFILVDPKRLELITYNGIPHLLHPVITEAKTTLRVLKWLTVEMDRRYRILASVGVKNIQGFNRKVAKEKPADPETGEPLTQLAYYVTIIDELADIMVTMGNEIYPPITRLSQMARAVGIHLVFATQRPSVDVVTGLIKANFPCRIAFQVTSKTDSRTILDINGAEKLLGSGDMLYLPKNRPTPLRIQGAFISEAETEKVASYWREFKSDTEEIEFVERVASAAADEAEIDDDLYNKAKELVIIHQQGSISLLQRRLRVGYARAARLIDMLEQAGIVGPFEGSKARRVLVRREEYEAS
ncbi:MAG: DNA translocase FtsK [bacterium]|nr:MAG: DNA translocase FtsK [bacterium]